MKKPRKILMPLFTLLSVFACGCTLPTCHLSCDGGGGGHYSISDGVFIYADGAEELTVIGYEECVNKIEIPSEFAGKPVTAIGRNAFENRYDILSVTVPDTITRIGDNAFAGCYKLVEVYNLSELEIEKGSSDFGGIGYYAFDIYTSAESESKIKTDEDCYNFYESETTFLLGYEGSGTVLTLPTGDYEIYNYAFYKNSDITEITIPYGVTKIGEKAFESCNGIEKVYWNASDCVWEGMPKEGVFADSDKLVSVVFGKKVNSIPDSAFYSCKNLETVEFGEGLTEIGKEAFYGCDKLQNISFPEGLIKIGDRAFSDCDGLKDISLPDSLTELGPSAFSYCVGVTSVSIGNSLAQIPKEAFNGCMNLLAVTIGAGVERIEKYAFSNCVKLIEVCNLSDIGEFAESVKNVYTPEIGESKITVTDEGYIFYSDETYNYLMDYGGSNAELILPESFNGRSYEIYNYAFYRKKYITSVEIPEGVTAIGENAFEYCSSLLNVTLPSGLTEIEAYLFSGCKNLLSVDIPEGVTAIGAHAFEYCDSLLSVTLPSGLTEIEYYLFNGCENLSSIDIPEGVTVIGAKAFSGCSSLINVILPEGLTEIKYELFSGCTSLSSVRIPDGVTTIGDSAFENCSSLTSITLPNGLTKIERELFSGCKSLSNVNIHEGITTIGERAFESCSSLTSITIPESVTKIGMEAFQFCGMVNLTVYRGEAQIGDYAFYGCNKLENVYFMGSLEEWCNSSYATSHINPMRYAKNLYIDGELLCELTIPEGITVIENYTFYGVDSLTNVIIPDSVTEIEADAFRACSNLANVTIGRGVRRIGMFAFYSCDSLENIYYTGDLATWCDASVFNTYSILNHEINLYIEGELLTELVIPEGIIDIANLSYIKCLETVVIPDSVVYMTSFVNCTNLKSIVIGSGFWCISGMAFVGCESLESIFYTGAEGQGDEQSYIIHIERYYNVIVYFYTETKPADAGNYWHYVDGKPTVW